MSREDKVKELIDKSNVATDAQMENRILGDALKHLDMLKQQKSACLGFYIRRTIMKSPIVKLAAAAVIIIACMIGLSLWRTTGSGIALADVLERVEQVKAFRCKGSFEMTGQTSQDKPYRWEVYYNNLESQEYGSKVIHEESDPNGGRITFAEIYFLPSKMIRIHISHRDKKYIRTELDDDNVQQIQKEYSQYSNPRVFLKEILECKYESLGRSTIDDIDVEGFGTKDPNCQGSGFGFKDPQVDVKIWVDVNAHLPVRYESLKSGIDEMGNRMSHRWIMQDFHWNVPVDSSEFELPVVPDGYIVQVEKPLGPVNEETAIQALRKCVDLLGKYPSSLSVALPRGLQLELDRSSKTSAMQLKEELKTLTEQEKVNRLMDVSMPMRLLFEFYIMQLVENDKDPAYYGKIVTPKDTDKVLLRWKLSDKEYRVIYGNLHTETITPEKLKELEKVLQR